MASSSTSGSATPTNAESALDIKIARPTKPGWVLEFIVRSKAKKESSAGSDVYSFRARLDELELAKVMKEVDDHNEVPGWNVVVLTIQKHLRDEGAIGFPADLHQSLYQLRSHMRSSRRRLGGSAGIRKLIVSGCTQKVFNRSIEGGRRG